MVESSSLVSVLFREAFSHAYISFFHLLVNNFCVNTITICNLKNFQCSACQCLMLHPYITASRTITNIELKSGIGHEQACGQPCRRRILSSMPSPFYTASAVLFQLHNCVNGFCVTIFHTCFKEFSLANCYGLFISIVHLKY